MIAAILRRFALAALIALAAGTAAGASIAGSGNLQTETRAVSGFTGIGLAVPGRVEVTMGERESFSITADDNLLPHIETVVERGMLKIRWRDHVNVSRVKSIRIAITAKALESLNVGGSGDIVGTSLRTGDLKVNIGGSGNVKLPGLTAAALAVSIGGSGDFSADGTAETLTANIGGSGDIKAGKLSARSAKVSVAGSGSAVVWAKNELTVTVAGSGDVRYYGDPSVTRAIVGSGSVKRLGAAPA
jgi:hypothetical protein